MADVPAKRDNNLFRELVPEAKSVLRRHMYSGDKKLSAQTAKDILDYAGLKSTPDQNSQRPIVIKDSQIQVLIQVAREVFEDAQ